jgi:tetratricopeptide (TPR) repeat protein
MRTANTAGMLSLCAIVKNEEDCIARMLASVRGVVDEVVLVDTGSTDKTLSIARDHGAKVIQRQWNDDFADARNVSIQHALHPWILILDADEELTPHSIEELRRCILGSPRALFLNRRHLCTSWTAAACTPVSSDDPTYAMGARTYFMTRDIRLFPNAPTIRYTGAVHESVEDATRQAGYAVESTSILINHYGHLTSTEKKRSKAALYLRLARQKALASPDDWRTWYQLGAELQAQMLHQEAIESYQKALNLIQDFSPLWREIGTSYLLTGDTVAALESFSKAITLAPSDPLSWTILGAAFLDLGNLEEAEQCYKTILLADPQNMTAKAQLELVLTKRASRS